MQSVAMAVEGVLAREDRAGGLLPDTEALALYAALSQGYRLTLVTCKPSLASQFLTFNGLRTHGFVLADPRYSRLEQLQRARGGFSIVVDSDPKVVAWAVHEGKYGLLWAAPTYRRPEFHPDAELGPREWSDVTDEVTRQRELRLADGRIEAAP